MTRAGGGSGQVCVQSFAQDLLSSPVPNPLNTETAAAFITYSSAIGALGGYREENRLCDGQPIVARLN